MTIARPPIFGRDVPDAAWRPPPELLADARLAGLLRATGAEDLETLQARAVDDPAWFWSAAVDDLGLDWQRRPASTMDISRGPEWATWWSGGAFNHAVAATEPRAARDPDGGAVAWEGEDGSVRRLTNRELATEVGRAARMFAAQGVRAGDRVGVFLPMRSSRRSSRVTARRPSRPGCATARRASSSPPTGSSAAAAASR